LTLPLLVEFETKMTISDPPEFTVNELPQFSPWPARLLGLETWQPRKKTPAEVAREYERDKWGSLLERYQATGGTATIETVEQWMLEGAAPNLCSVGERLELLHPRAALDRHYAVIADTIAKLLPASSIVELGAGCGSAILRLATDSRFKGVPFQAAEYTRSGMELMKQLAAAAGIDLKVGRCDLGSTALTDLSIPERSIVFTCMAAHYIPQLENRFVSGLTQLRPRAVVHFEPCAEHCDTRTLMGALRRRYIELNDYNQNLVSLLRQHAASGKIRVVEELAAVIGVNPLLPISVLVWEPLASEI
jgi:hypothetical protein